MKRSLKAMGIIFLVLAALLLGIKFKYGGGRPYPDLSQAPLVSEKSLETIVSLPYPLGNIAVSGSGRIFFNYHPFAKVERFESATVFELIHDKAVPFPSLDFQKKYQGVFGMTVDHQDRLWFIEPAGLDHERTRLLAFDLRTMEKVFEFAFPPKIAQFAQDLRVTRDGKTALIADTGFFQFTSPGLMVFDIESRSFKVFIAEHPSARPQDWVIRSSFGPLKLGYGLVTFSVGIDGIAISEDEQWLYYGAMSHEKLYRIPLQALLDPAANDASIQAQIQDVGLKPLSDGIALDDEGRVLITDVENGGIARLNPSNGQLETLVKSPHVIWADGVVVTPDGATLFTDSGIPAYIDQLGRPPSRERLQASAPYRIYRFRSDDENQ